MNAHRYLKNDYTNAGSPNGQNVSKDTAASVLFPDRTYVDMGPGNRKGAPGMIVMMPGYLKKTLAMAKRMTKSGQVDPRTYRAMRAFAGADPQAFTRQLARDGSGKGTADMAISRYKGRSVLDPDPAHKLAKAPKGKFDPTGGQTPYNRYDTCDASPDCETRKALRYNRGYLRRLGITASQALSNMGFEAGSDIIDKNFVDAVVKFQSRIGGTKPDGIYGPNTHRKTKAGRKSRKSRRTRRAPVTTDPKLPPQDRATVRRARRAGAVGAIDDLLRESKNLEEMGCGGHSPGKGDEKDRQGIIADEKGKKYGVMRDGTPCNCEQEGCGGPNCTDMSEGKTEKCEKCANCGCKGKGCVKCDNCKDCNPVDKSKDGNKNKSKDGNKSTSKYDDNPKLKGKQANLPDQLQKGIIQAAESKIYTPEQEQELYESRFNDRNDRIFDKLKKLWTK